MATSIKLDDVLKERGQCSATEQRESFKQEALASWAEYGASGQHLAGDEVHRWLRSWGADEETEIPACHD